MFNWRSEPIKDKDEKALDCKDAIDDLGESLAELYSQQFDLVVTKYESALTRLEHKASMLEERISQSEARGQVVNTSYYDALIKNEQNEQAKLIKQRAEMKAAMNDAMNSGTLAKYSEEWYRMVEEINGVTLAIEESETSVLEYQQSIREIEWEKFDLLQTKISDITKETEFLIDLMSNDELYNKDTGQLTSEGMATMGLHAENYSVHMKQAAMYQSEIDKISKQIAKDPTNQELIDKKREFIEAQQDSIAAAEGEKNAIRDMVEEGINLELDALQERIDKYNEALQTQKDLYDFQKKVKDQTKEIADLEKQMAAYAGDDSEENKQRIQKLKVELEDAKSELEETEYDKYLQDSGELLDKMYEKYEEILNERLDDVDLLMEDMVAEVNNNTSVIAKAISDAAKEVGYNISQANNTAWGSNGDINSSTNTAISGVESEHNRSVDTSANTTIPDAANSPEASGTTQNNEKLNIGDKVTLKKNSAYYSGSTKDSKKAGTVSKAQTLYITAINPNNKYPYRLSWRADRTLDGTHNKPDLGWIKNKSNLSGYASGVEELYNDELAWTQEKGTEFIMRRSDGAILTPLAQGDGVLNAVASKNLWNMANNPADFIRDNLGLDDVAVPSSGNVHNNIENNFDKVVFSLPSVTNYDEFKKAMVKDKDIDRFIKSITLDRLAGKSSLAKYKSVR